MKHQNDIKKVAYFNLPSPKIDGKIKEETKFFIPVIKKESIQHEN
jgi:hypothetical protein